MTRANQGINGLMSTLNRAPRSSLPANGQNKLSSDITEKEDMQLSEAVPAVTEGFTALGLSPDVVKAVVEKGYTTPTPIQEQAIPYVLMGRDVMGCAQTGTGKTASFTLPMIEILAQGRAKARMPRSLVLAPTRELATQVAENFQTYGKYHKLSMALLIGGETMDEQIKLLDRGVDVLIATPGRMMDLHGRGRVLLNDIKILVIDEADRMLDMGFIPDVEKIVSLLPPLRQTLFFSATLATEVKKIAKRFLSNPKEIAVAPSATTAATVTQHLVKVTERQKREVLRTLLRQEEVQNAMIFCNRKRDVAVLLTSLQQHGFNVGALHGDMVQSKRTETLDAFKRNTINILVCSDVAGRGLDISGLSHVFNFDVPFNAEDYVHRIGRTGRAGKSGVAYTLATSDEDKLVEAIEKLIKQPLPALGVPVVAEVSDVPSQINRPERSKRERTPRRHESRPETAVVPRARPPRAVPVAVDEGADDRTSGFGDHLPAFMRG
jgi:superfamily II DNA/RNA helicase